MATRYTFIADGFEQHRQNRLNFVGLANEPAIICGYTRLSYSVHSRVSQVQSLVHGPFRGKEYRDLAGCDKSLCSLLLGQHISKQKLLGCSDH